MRWLVFALFFFTVAQQAHAIDAVVTHTLFYQPNPAFPGRMMTFMELSWEVNPNTLHYRTNGDKTISGNIRTEVILSDEAGVFKRDLYIRQTMPIHSVNELLQHDIIDQRRYNLPEGEVKVTLILSDNSDSTNRFKYTDSFMISVPPKNYFFSGLKMLDTVFTNESPSPFLKNGKQQVPFCSNFLDDNRRMIYYYSELYSQGKISEGAFPLIRRIAISKSENEGSYADLVHTDTILTQEQLSVKAGKFYLASLPSGNYYLRAWLDNSSRETIASQSLFFQRLNKQPIVQDTVKKVAAINDTGIENVTVLNLNKTFLAKYNLAQVRAILKMLLPLSDQAGVRTINGFLKKPDELYMRYFIYNYFAAINKKDPGKAWKEFSAKITEVNKLFNAGSVPGYETERGFVYLRYGAPTDIINVENEQGTLPYEVWQYTTLRLRNQKDKPDAVFLFYKPGYMTSDYRLLHSNVEGEVQNVQWRSTLYVNGQGGDNVNSRAEQYMNNK